MNRWALVLLGVALAIEGPVAVAAERAADTLDNALQAEMARLRAEGFALLNEEPKRGADNKLVCFVHPRSAGGVLVELCQEVS